MTSPHPAQGIPSDQPINPEADASVGITELAAVAPTAVPLPTPQSTPPPRRHRWAALLAGTAAVAAVGVGGITAYASAHKSITLDVDGKVTTVETYQGDVAGLLADEGVEVTNRDAVTPGADGALRDGGMVVVRYGHHVTFQADGVRRAAWVAALDADQALATLSRRAGDVALVPSRSGGRVTLPMRLDADSPVNLVVGGKVQRVSEGAAALDDLLADRDVTVDADDRITVERRQPAGPPSADPGAPTLTVVVKKVETSVERTVTRLPFDKVTAQDPDRFEDLDPYLATEGVVGKRVTSWDVTRVDGKVVDRNKLSSTVERKPVDQVVMYGTKARPEPEAEPAPPEAVEPAPVEAAEPEPEPDDGAAVTGDVWAALAECESGGDPTANTGNGYYGLYQFSLPTWEAMGGAGLPSDASAAEQTIRARALQQQSGWGQWPACAASLGLY